MLPIGRQIGRRRSRSSRRRVSFPITTSSRSTPTSHWKGGEFDQHVKTFRVLTYDLPSIRPWLMGRVSALIHDVPPAKVIVDDMVNDAARILQHNASLVKVNPRTKL